MGFETIVTKPSQDGGVDVIAELKQPLLRGRVLVQCKRYQGSIGEPIVRELVGVVDHERAMKGIIICTSRFTAGAEKFAEGKPIELIDGSELERLIKRYWIGEESFNPTVANSAGLQSGFDIVLGSAGAQKIPVIKIVRDHKKSLGLAEAKQLIESAPVILCRDIPIGQAQEIKRQLEAVGAVVEIRRR